MSSECKLIPGKLYGVTWPGGINAKLSPEKYALSLPVLPESAESGGYLLALGPVVGTCFWKFLAPDGLTFVYLPGNNVNRILRPVRHEFEPAW